MKRNKKIVLLVTVLVVLSILIFWLYIRIPNKIEPERLTSIPKSAVWNGGVDGGFWFDFVSEQIDSNKVRLRIYNDYNGTLILDADFTSENCKVPKGKTVLDSINYFEFKKVILLNGCELTAVNPTYAGSF